MLANRIRMTAPPYTANAVKFDGTNDWLTRDAGLTGAANSKMFTLSVWIKVNANSTAMRVFANLTTLGGATERLNIFRNANNQLRVINTNGAGTERLNLHSADNSVKIANGWVHVLTSVDMADTAKRHLYIDDASDLTVATYTDDTLEFTTADWAVGGDADGSNKFDGDMADLWFEDGLYTDFSVVANRRKFIGADLKPVSLGGSGSAPFGAAPIVFLANPTATWQNNKGTGGGFTENGALTTAATSPSD